MTLDTLNIKIEVFADFFGDFRLRNTTFQERIAPKSIAINNDKLRELCCETEAQFLGERHQQLVIAISNGTIKAAYEIFSTERKFR